MKSTPATSQPYPLPALLRRAIQVGWVLLALNSLWTFAGTLYFTWAMAVNASPRIADGLAELGISPTLYFWVNALPMSLVFLTYFGAAMLLFVRLPNDRMALFVAVFLMAFGAANSYPMAREFLVVWNAEHLLYTISFGFNNLLAWPLLMAFFTLYPDGIFVPRRMRYIALYCLIFSLLWSFFPQAFGAPNGWLALFVVVSVLIIFGGSLYAQIYRYRYHSTPVQRQQTKWMVLGMAVMVTFILTQAITSIVADNDPTLSAGKKIALELIFMPLSLVSAGVPIAVAIAILRYRLYDIDILIHRTLVYSAITALLALTYAGSVVVLQALFVGVTGQTQSQLVTVMTTLMIAALFFPLRNRVQIFIDRRFYRRKYDAAQTLAAFAAAARDEVELERLTSKLVQVVDETMQPEGVDMWLAPIDRADGLTGNRMEPKHP